MLDHMKCKCEGPVNLIWPTMSGNGASWKVACMNCGRNGPWHESQDAAWAAWDADRAPSPAIEKAREVLREHMAVNAATMRFIIEMGLIDSFIAELKSAGVKDGFGVRGNEALALLEVE